MKPENTAHGTCNGRQPAAPSRREFFKKAVALAWSFLFAGGTASRVLAREQKLNSRPKKNTPTQCDLAVVRGDNVRQSLRRALDELGGLDRFVRKGDTVVVKPNIGWNRGPELAANTNPDLINELVLLCRRAGARRVRVFDNTCNNEKMCYRNSGIQDAVTRAGGEIYFVTQWKFLPGNFPEGSAMQSWPIFRDAVECDCFINVPIAKHHSLTGLTLSMKNLMGVCGGSRGTMHWNIDTKLAELTSFINPDLTIIDAYRILLRHGPSSGNPGDVELKKTVLASRDPVLADAFAATLFNLKPGDIGHIVKAARRNIGTMDIALASIRRIDL